MMAASPGGLAARIAMAAAILIVAAFGHRLFLPFAAAMLAGVIVSIRHRRLGFYIAVLTLLAFLGLILLGLLLITMG